MQRISSNLSLFWKIFVPTFWFSFYGIFTIAVWVNTDSNIGIFSELNFRLAVTAFYVIGSLIMYFTIMTIKRVEYENDYLYVSNYFRTIKIPFALIKYIDIHNYTIFKRGKIYLNKDTPFGKSIVFIVSSSLIKIMQDEYPQHFEYNYSEVINDGDNTDDGV